MTSRRLLQGLFAGLGIAAVVCGLVLQLRTVAEEDPDPVATVGDAAVTNVPRSPEVAVISAWDRRRAAAYAAADVRALRALYRPASRSGAADVRMLEEYVDRGLRVRGLRMQLLAVEVIRSDAKRVLLEVTDRMVGAEVVGRGEPVRLPVDRASHRRVGFVLVDGSWVVTEVRPVGAR